MEEPKDGDTGLKTLGRIRKYIYRWITGTKSAGPLIVIPGGSAQMADILKEAVEAEDLPDFENQHMEIITEDKIRRV
eukprot:5497181-Heterocapsa_arctica.AAC.1